MDIQFYLKLNLNSLPSLLDLLPLQLDIETLLIHPIPTSQNLLHKLYRFSLVDFKDPDPTPLSYYHLKWAKARLASATFSMSVFFFTAPPSPFAASDNSAANF